MSSPRGTVRRRLLARDYQVILFDLDGTLYPSTVGIERQIIPSIRRTAVEMLSVPIEEAKRLIRKYNREYGYCVHGFEKLHGIPAVEFIERVYAGLDRSTIPISADLVTGFESIRCRVGTIAVMTNSSRTHGREVLTHLGLSEHVNRVLGIEDTEFRLKPDFKAYEVFLEQLAVEPSDVLYFDDSVRNIYAGWQLGMDSILVSNGVADPPRFWEVHLRVAHDAPEYASAFTHDLPSTLRDLSRTP